MKRVYRSHNGANRYYNGQTVQLTNAQPSTQRAAGGSSNVHSGRLCAFTFANGDNAAAYIHIMHIQVAQIKSADTCIQQQQEHCAVPFGILATLAGVQYGVNILQGYVLKYLLRYFGRRHFADRVAPCFRHNFLRFHPIQERTDGAITAMYTAGVISPPHVPTDTAVSRRLSVRAGVEWLGYRSRL